MMPPELGRGYVSRSSGAIEASLALYLKVERWETPVLTPRLIGRSNAHGGLRLGGFHLLRDKAALCIYAFGINTVRVLRPKEDPLGGRRPL